MSKLELKVQRIRTQFSPNYEVIGSKEECEIWLENLKRSFHPAGYGTHGKFIEELPNGDFVMSAYRANSCD